MVCAAYWRLTLVGSTSHGHTMLRAHCVFNPEAHEGRLTVKRADVLAGKIKRCCWHLRHAARWAPLRSRK